MRLSSEPTAKLQACPKYLHRWPGQHVPRGTGRGVWVPTGVSVLAADACSHPPGPLACVRYDALYVRKNDDEAVLEAEGTFVPGEEHSCIMLRFPLKCRCLASV